MSLLSILCDTSLEDLEEHVSSSRETNTIPGPKLSAWTTYGLLLINDNPLILEMYALSDSCPQ